MTISLNPEGGRPNVTQHQSSAGLLTIRATDGLIGTVDDLHFDDEDPQHATRDDRPWRLGGSIVQRLLRVGHTCVVFDSQPSRLTSLSHDGATGSHSLAEFVRAFDSPRADLLHYCRIDPMWP
jgi:hypothetical protein